MKLCVGYFSSCVLGNDTSEDRASTGVVVVDWEGSLVRHEAPETVAELMMEAPGHLVVSAEEVTRTRRAHAMRADEPLRPGGVYLLFPAGRAGSRLPDQQTVAVERACRAERKPKRGRKSRSAARRRVFPGVVGSEETATEDRKVKRGNGGGHAKPIFSGEEGNCGVFPGCRSVAIAARPWRPALETIGESM